MQRILGAFFTILVVFASGQLQAGTFYNPVGEPGTEKAGAEASAQLNEGIASLHLMYAAIERRDKDGALKMKSNVERQLETALNIFTKIQEMVPEKALTLKPRNATEIEILDQFYKISLPNQKLDTPKTQKDLAKLAVSVVGDFLTRVKKTGIFGDAKDWIVARDLIRNELLLQQIGLATSLIWVLSSN